MRLKVPLGGKYCRGPILALSSFYGKEGKKRDEDDGAPTSDVLEKVGVVPDAAGALHPAGRRFLLSLPLKLRQVRHETGGGQADR